MKARLGVLALAALAAALGGCGGGAPAAGPEEEAVTIAVTKWTEKSELFLEYPPLVAGETGRFAVHLTDLRTFRPVAAGRVVVELARGGAVEDRFVAEGPSSPGIFGVDVTPREAGEFSMTVRLESPGLADTLPLGEVTVYPNAAQAAEAAPPEEAGEEISFLKEQQWTLEFGTGIVEERRLRASLRVPAEVIPRAGGAAEVRAPFDGMIQAARLPAVGSRVEQGQMLAELLPPTSAPSDWAALELARAEASERLELARRDRERAERLLEAGAVPARRLEEARATEAMAEARLEAAEARLAQFEVTSAGEADARGGRLFALRAPISGTVTQVNAASGAMAKAGDVLFQIVDTDTVNVSAIVPEAELPRMRSLSGAELEVPGAEAPRRLGRLLSVGRVVDPASRTFPVIYELANRDGEVAVNQTVYVRLLTEEAEARPVVPESAIVDDGGRPIVFVQTGGESFARRPVRLGLREGGLVQVLEGVEAGERVVTRGAHLIRLAALSTQVPAHGHVH